MVGRFGPGCCCPEPECGATIRTTVTACQTVPFQPPAVQPLQGATVTIKGPLPATTTVGTCTTNSSGLCNVAVPSLDDYLVEVSKTGFQTTSVQVTADTCDATENVSVELPLPGGFPLSIRASVCPCFGPGVELELTGPHGYSASATSDADGFFPAIPGVPYRGTYDFTASYPGAETLVDSFTVPALTCSTTLVPIALSSPAGHWCLGPPEDIYSAFPSPLSVTLGDDPRFCQLAGETVTITEPPIASDITVTWGQCFPVTPGGDCSDVDAIEVVVVVGTHPACGQPGATVTVRTWGIACGAGGLLRDEYIMAMVSGTAAEPTAFFADGGDDLNADVSE